MKEQQQQHSTLVLETLLHHRHLEVTAFLGPSQKPCGIRTHHKRESQHIELGRVWTELLLLGQARQVDKSLGNSFCLYDTKEVFS